MSRLPLPPDPPPWPPSEGDGAPESVSSATGLNVARALAVHPPALAAVGALPNAGYLSDALPADLRELAYLTASLENSCHY